MDGFVYIMLPYCASIIIAIAANTWPINKKKMEKKYTHMLRNSRHYKPKDH